MGKRVDIENILSAQEVAEVLGLGLRNSITVYRGRYPDFPEPLKEWPGFKVWNRPDVTRWARKHRRKRPPDANLPP